MELDINFSGVVANIVATGLAYYDNKKEVKHWLKKSHPYMWLPLSPDTVKWKIAHPEDKDALINPWDNIAGKRSENYDISI